MKKVIGIFLLTIVLTSCGESMEEYKKRISKETEAELKYLKERQKVQTDSFDKLIDESKKKNK